MHHEQKYRQALEELVETQLTYVRLMDCECDLDGEYFARVVGQFCSAAALSLQEADVSKIRVFALLNEVLGSDRLRADLRKVLKSNAPSAGLAQTALRALAGSISKVSKLRMGSVGEEFAIVKALVRVTRMLEGREEETEIPIGFEVHIDSANDTKLEHSWAPTKPTENQGS